MVHCKDSFVNVWSRGADGSGDSDCTEQLQQAIDEAAALGATLFFPRGVYVAGTLYLRDNVTVKLAEGACLRGNAATDCYPPIAPVVESRMDKQPWKAFLYGQGLSNVTIHGGGSIEPGGDARDFDNPEGGQPARPYGIHLVSCTNVSVRGITLKNSAFWMQRYFNCENLRISGITVFNHCNFNNDGLNIDGCRRVFVDNCRIDSSDDALVLKSEGEPMCEDVVVTNCILSSRSSALKLGTGSVGGFRRIAVSNCVIRPCEAEKIHHEIGVSDGLMGIDLGCVDGGILEDVVVSDTIMDGPETPIFMRLGSRNSRPGGATVERGRPMPGTRLESIMLSNIVARNAGPIAATIHGMPGCPLRDITLDTISLHHGRAGTERDLGLDVRDEGGDYPMNRMFQANLPAFGFYVRHAANVSMRNINLHAAPHEVRPGCVFDDIDGLRVDSMRVHSPRGDQRPVRFLRCRDRKTRDIGYVV